MKGKRSFPLSLAALLEQRSTKKLFRELKCDYPAIDFASNDYLGFSTQGLLSNEFETSKQPVKTGSTGSRLISGNSSVFTETENEIASFHRSEAALLYNSGYDANLGLLSSVPQKGDLVLCDELIHASLIDGVRLSFASHYKFKHNDVSALKELIGRHKDSFHEIYVVVESVYSMDGDQAPLAELAALCEQDKLHLIVDEAHAIGVFGEKGRGLCNALNIEKKCFARIYTYGKAMGCHGAAVLGSSELKHYLVNFSRSFIYTTAMPVHSLLAIKAAYRLLETTAEINKLQAIISYFNSKAGNTAFIESTSAIHCKIVPGNAAVQRLEEDLTKAGLFVKSIRSPTVKETQERVRICLHSFNTKKEIDVLLELLQES